MIKNQKWHTNHAGEGYGTVRNRLRIICSFPAQYDSKELATAIAAFPEILKDYKELIRLVEKIDPDRARKSKQLLQKAGQ